MSPACSLLTSDVIEPSATNLARCCYDGQKPGLSENKILSCVCPAPGVGLARHAVRQTGNAHRGSTPGLSVSHYLGKISVSTVARRLRRYCRRGLGTGACPFRTSD